MTNGFSSRFVANGDPDPDPKCTKPYYNFLGLQIERGQNCDCYRCKRKFRKCEFLKRDTEACDCEHHERLKKKREEEERLERERCEERDQQWDDMNGMVVGVIRGLLPLVPVVLAVCVLLHFSDTAATLILCISICVVVFNVQGNKVARWIDKYDTIEEQEKRGLYLTRRRPSRQNDETTEEAP
jgi:hypothetical protein